MSCEYPVQQLNSTQFTRSCSMLQHPPPWSDTVNSPFRLQRSLCASRQSCLEGFCQDIACKLTRACKRKVVPLHPISTNANIGSMSRSEQAIFLHGGSYILAFALPCVVSGIKNHREQMIKASPKRHMYTNSEIIYARKSTIVDAATVND